MIDWRHEHDGSAVCDSGRIQALLKRTYELFLVGGIPHNNQASPSSDILPNWVHSWATER